MPWPWGRECKAGWGYNESLDKLIPVEGEPPEFKLVDMPAVIRRNRNCYIHDLSSTLIPNLKTISLFLEKNCRKFLDFQIVFDEDEYWEVKCSIYKRMERSGKFPTYSPNFNHFVALIYHGVDFWIQFPKTGFSENSTEIGNLFHKGQADESQKKTKCRILINSREIREMTLGELIKLMSELEEHKNSQYDAPVIFSDQKLNSGIREPVIDNKIEFCQFLSYLYCVYRKIEMKMEKVGYPDILPDLDSEESSFDNIRTNLNKAKEDYKVVDKNNFLKMYPVLKKLFFSYIDYIKYSIEHTTDMDEGDYLPETVNEMKLWLKQLNGWVPVI